MELTPRQKEILKLVNEYKRTRDIADILAISERTVNLHIGEAMKRLGARSRFEAASIALESGFLLIEKK